MGLFKKEISIDESVLVQTFQVIAQAIDVAAQTGIDKETGIEIADVWALYFWAIKPLENNPKRLNPYLYSHLKNSPGSPGPAAKHTQTHLYPSQLVFPVHPDDNHVYLKIVGELKEFLETRYLSISKVDDSVFLEECGVGLEKIIKQNLPILYSKSTQAIIFILITALRSILNDTKRIDSDTARKLRKSGIFHISLMATSWHFPTEGTL